MATLSVPEVRPEAVTVIKPPRGPLPFGRVVLYIVLVIGGIIAALPFFWMIFGAFKTGAEIRQIPPTFVPQDWTLENFSTILNDPDLPLATYYRNSLFVALTNVAVTLFTSSILGFIFAALFCTWGYMSAFVAVFLTYFIRDAYVRYTADTISRPTVSALPGDRKARPMTNP